MADQSKFTKKVSPLIEGQVPDFVQADHPVFVNFVKDYFQFLEAGRLTLTQSINYIVQETASTSYILDETDGERIVTEIGEGTLGQFVVGETVTGGTSKATAKVLVEDSRNTYLYITGQQKFVNDETITGSTSGSTATVNEYRGNPIQNIQQMLEYANVDNTLFDFLNQMRDQFLASIPENLASGIDKRKLIKNIKDLYSAKGTSEGHKLFMRMLLDESAEIFYPNQYMMRVSNAEWTQQSLIRVIPIGGSSGDEIINQLITGATSGATAIVESAVTSQQQNETFNDSVTSLQIANISGTFLGDETITAVSTSRDVTVSFTVKGIVADTTITNDGILHVDTESIQMEQIGNAFATVVVDGIAEGSVSEVIVDDVGSSYEVGDTVLFTANSVDESVAAATGFVSMVGGGILQEGTTSDTILIEDGTNTNLEDFKIALESTESDNFLGDGTTTTFTFTNLNGVSDAPLYITFDDVVFPQFKKDGSTQWTVSATQIIFTEAPDDRTKIFIRGQEVDFLLLNATNVVGATSVDAGHNILTNNTVEVADTHTTSSDQIVLEFDTFEDVDSASTESGSIQKVFVSSGGAGYTKLPTVSVSETTSGSGVKLISTTTNIGAAKSMKITDSGFRYSPSNPPEAIFRAHFVLKDVTGTFGTAAALTTHTGVVKGWDSTTQVLDTTFENVIRLQQEQAGTFNEGIQLEQGNLEHMPSGVLLEDEQDFDDGENIVLDGTGTSTPSPQTITFKVKVVYDTTLEQNIFYVQDEAQPILTLFEGNTYYFDLSDSSLYNATTTLNHQLKFSSTSDGTHNDGTAYTTGVTTSAATIDIGTAGAYIQIVVASGAPTLFYYCANHSGMGNQANTSQYVTTVDNEGSAIIFNSTDHGPNIANISLESGVVGRKDTDVILLEDNSGTIFLEETLIGQLADVGDNILIDRYRENKNAGSQFIILEDDSNGKLSTEDFGDSLLLNSSAASTDEGSKIILADETGDGNIILNATDSSSTDASGDIINESPIDFSNRDVVITDSDGASGTIVTADIATGTTAVATTSTTAGEYNKIANRLGEDLVRIQDSYYYQDYSYEVQIGQSFSTYVNELKKAVHPAGFQPFGKVTLATLVSAEIQTAAAGVAAYTGDTATFSPILASTFETLFTQVLQSRLQTVVPMEIGNRDEKIIQEDGVLPGNNLVLDASAASTDVGDNILFEDGQGMDLEDGFHMTGDAFLYEVNTRTHDDFTTAGTGTGGGRMMSEKSHAPSGKGDRVVVKEFVTKISARPTPKRKRNLLIYLAETPFGNENGGDGIALESSASVFDTGNLLVDGTLPLDQTTTFTELERNTIGDNILLDGTSATAADAGDSLLLEDGFVLTLERQSLGVDGETFRILNEDDDGSKTSRILQEGGEWNFPLNFASNIGDRLILDGNNNNEETIPLSDISHFQFSDILRKEKFIINDGSTNIFDINGGEDVGLQMEDAGQLLLEDGFHLAQETTKRNRFDLEINGALVVEDFDTISTVELLLDENEDNIVFEDYTENSFWGSRGLNNVTNFGIKLEYGEGTILLDSHGGDTSIDLGAGDQLLLEEDFTITTAVALESTNKIISKGQIPLKNLTLNSNEILRGYDPIVRSADINVRSTGELVLEDATDTTNSNTNYLLEETNGDNLDLEGATGLTV